MWESRLGDQGRGQGNPLRMNLIPGATPRKRNERRTILSFAKLCTNLCTFLGHPVLVLESNTFLEDLLHPAVRKLFLDLKEALLHLQ